MAKGNLLLGTAAGSIGDVTLMRRSGSQVARVRVRKVSNPRSSGQQFQRVVATTIGRAYSQMLGICDHSFQNESGKAANQAMFMSKNMNMLRSKARVTSINGTTIVKSNLIDGTTSAYIAPGQDIQLVPNEYVIATGSLTPQGVGEIYKSSTPLSEGGLYSAIGWSLLLEGLTEASMATITYDELAAYIGAKIGDQVTFCAIVCQESNLVPVQMGNTTFEYARVILSPADGDTTKPVFTAAATGSSLYVINDPNSQNVGDLRFYYSDTDEIGVGVGSLVNARTSSYMIEAGGVILSRRSSSGVWQRSNSQMVCAANPSHVWNLDQALADFEGFTLNPDQYLDQANTNVTSLGEA